VEFVEADAETIPLVPATFNAVVSRWGLLFFQDPVGALVRFRASLVPGGWLAAAIWGPPEHVPLISLPFRALGGAQERPSAPPSDPNPFALSEPEALETTIRDAGFADIQRDLVTVTFTFSSVGELLGHIADVSAPVRAITATMSQERQATFWERLAEAAHTYTDADGVVRLPNDCLLVAGHR
jgi:SAM-dependent methyltransferase